jgi:hypothetical protein
MPEGAAAFGTLAGRTVGNAVWEGPFALPLTNLLAGTNVIAAEVHQSTTTSTGHRHGHDARCGLAAALARHQRAGGYQRLARCGHHARGSPPHSGPVQRKRLWPGTPPTCGSVASSATNLLTLASHDYVFQFAPTPAGNVTVTWAPANGITDRSSNSNAFTGTSFNYFLDAAGSVARLAFATVSQSSDATAATGALLAVDGSTNTFSLTASDPGSYWQAQFGRPFPLQRLEIVNRPVPFAAELGGLTLQLFNLDDQVVFSAPLTNPGPGGQLTFTLPEGTVARSLRIGLAGSETNGAGNYRVGMAEVRAFGTPDLPVRPAARRLRRAERPRVAVQRLRRLPCGECGGRQREQLHSYGGLS